ncbi:MAG: inositol monophosphatase [Alphaproteobacteria bacterium]|nr:inositol monophosphatase [Alphaproteobacteria bacterium]
MARPSPTINVMTAAARKAARDLVRDFGEVEQLQVSRKGPADFVSAADLKAEKTLHRELSRARPGFGFLMEEGGERAGDGLSRWIIDPLDGTTNFLHGVPHFAISIALESEGELVAGVVHQPLTDETYWAERGAGAYLNDRRLRVSARTRLEDSLIGTGIPFKGEEGHAHYLATLAAVTGQVSGVRRMGAASLDLAYVAAGRFEAFWEFELRPWDIAAGVLLVREAGGYVTTPTGGLDVLESGDVLAANDRLHQPLAELLRSVPRPVGAAA